MSTDQTVSIDPCSFVLIRGRFLQIPHKVIRNYQRSGEQISDALLSLGRDDNQTGG